jgi:hypothetical protein
MRRTFNMTTSLSGAPMSRAQIMRASRAPGARDYQRARLYRWEDEVLPRDPDLLSLADCQAQVDLVFQKHGMTGPEVRDGRGCRRALFFPTEYRISLPRHCRALPVVLHEAAHGLVDFGPGAMRFRTMTVVRGPVPCSRVRDPADRRPAWSAHGPIFAAIYIALLDEYGIASAEALRRSAIDCRLDVARFEPEDGRADARFASRRCCQQSPPSARSPKTI